MVAQEIERAAQRAAPALVPPFLGVRMTTAIAVPAADAVRAAPRSALAAGPRLDLDLHPRRVRLEESSVVRERDASGRRLDGGRMCERELAEAEVVTVALAVGRDVNDAIGSAAPR